MIGRHGLSHQRDLRQILRDSGLIQTRRLSTLVPLYVDPEVESALQALGDAGVVAALTGQVM